MKGGGIRLGSTISVMALAISHAAHAQVTQPNPNEGAAQIERSRRLSLSVPLVSETQAYGDILIEVDLNGGFAVDSDSLVRELENLLNDEGKKALERAIGGQPLIDAGQLAAQGFSIKFDQSLLQVKIERIDPTLLAVQQLGPSRQFDSRVDLRTIEPARVSSYLNVTANFDYDSDNGSDAPDLFLDGATRIGGIVVEYDGALSDQFGDSYEFLRRSTRAVYDDPGSYRRYAAGDLRLDSLSILRNPQIGGVSVEKRRQIFDPFQSVSQLGGRQIFLDNRSTVDVLINGNRFDSFQLDAGTYDLANLPIQQGSNEVQLLIRDSFGQERIIDYNFFFENLSLPPGEEEYSFALGVLSRPLGFEQDYTDEIAASGLYRRALSQNLVLGGAFQLSEDAQVVAASAAVVPQFIPGVFDIETAVSRSDSGTGFAFRAGFRTQSGGSLENSSQLSINVDYESSAFRTIDLVLPINFDLLSVAATYTRSFTPRLFAVAGGNFVRNSGRDEDSYNAFFDLNYRVSDKIRLTAGAEYGSSFADRTNFGVRIGLTWAFGGRARANADYRSRIDSYRLNLSRGADAEIGSFGYDIGLAQFGDQTQGDAQFEYVSNRFTTRADVTSTGNNLSSVFDQQRVRVQVGTSIAMADGTLGIGRPINNSFLVARPDSAIRDQGIVTARTLNGSDYYAASGTFGAAVQGDLTPYAEQNVQFDAADPDDGFDVGDGTVLVNPPYKSGYKLTIGNAYFVSAIGFLADEDGPVSFASGVVESADGDDEFETLPFFTNEQGRFAIFGFAVGRTYRVTLTDSGRVFEIAVPEDAGTLLRTETIQIEKAP